LTVVIEPEKRLNSPMSEENNSDSLKKKVKQNDEE